MVELTEITSEISTDVTTGVTTEVAREVSGGVTDGESGTGRVSPAAHLAERFAAAEVTGERAVALRELAFLTMVGLRTTPGSAAADRIEQRLGLVLPRSCGTVGAGERVEALWLSPDEFLVVSAGRQPEELTGMIVEAIGEDPGSAVDLSANRTTFELSGPMARAVLEKGCPLDLHPRSFPTGSAYLSLVGSVPVVVWSVADERFRILPRSSFADFLGRWLLDAMNEFRTPEMF